MIPGQAETRCITIVLPGRNNLLLVFSVRVGMQNLVVVVVVLEFALLSLLLLLPKAADPAPGFLRIRYIGSLALLVDVASLLEMK
jgi:hypothetical protein